MLEMRGRKLGFSHGSKCGVWGGGWGPDEADLAGKACQSLVSGVTGLKLVAP